MTTPVSTIPHAKRWESLTKFLCAVLGLLYLGIFAGIFTTNLDVFFLFLTVVTGFYWALEKMVWSKYLTKDSKGELNRPWWLSWTAAIFPVVIGLFLFRGFIAEPVKIPTGSMIPTIMIGDISIVNKFYYDVKLPIVEKSIYKNNTVKHGDVVVFRYPKQPSIYYIKRFVGVPGDKVHYNFETKVLSLNNQIVPRVFEKEISIDGHVMQQFEENLNGVKHKILIDNAVNGLAAVEKIDNTSNGACQYTLQEMTCILKEGQYFAMGDNRDNSLDSRYWGVVPHSHLVGKAQVIALSTSSLSQIGWLK